MTSDVCVLRRPPSFLRQCDYSLRITGSQALWGVSRSSALGSSFLRRKEASPATKLGEAELKLLGVRIRGIDITTSTLSASFPALVLISCFQFSVPSISASILSSPAVWWAFVMRINTIYKHEGRQQCLNWGTAIGYQQEGSPAGGVINITRSMCTCRRGSRPCCTVWGRAWDGRALPAVLCLVWPSPFSFCITGDLLWGKSVYLRKFHCCSRES